MTKNTQAAWNSFWNSHYRSKSNNIVLSFIRKNVISKAVRSMFDKYFPDKGYFLEAGSGSSETSEQIRISERFLISLDFSIRPLANAKRMPVIASAVQGDMYNLPFLNGSIDGIWNLGVMEHFTDVELDKILHEFWRVLKPSGRCILFWPPLIGWYKFSAISIEAFLSIIKRSRVILYPGEVNLYKRKSKIVDMCKKRFVIEHVGHTPLDLFTYVVIVIKKINENQA